MLPILVGILIAVNVVALTVHASTKSELEVQRSMVVKERTARQDVSKRLTELSEEKVNIDSSLREKRLEAEKLKKENQSLKVNLQAKKEREAQEAKKAQVAAVQTEQVQVAAPAVQVSGDKQSWLAASGIPASEWASVDFIVSRESGWNPNAVNPSSGACGLGQQLPCGKWAGAWNDPVAALKAQYGYVKERYGGYPQAVAFWQSNNWY